MAVPVPRRSSRAILLDANGRVLLIRFAIVRKGEAFVFWAAPGGSVEAGETDLDAARREVKEELAVNVALTGPVHTSVNRFLHKNVPVENIDVFFVGRLDVADPKLHAASDEERAAMQLAKWWSCDEVDQTTETIFPPDLSTVIRRLI
ncbi:NUDIX domain-containing protein [Tardiphaga robiniae]|uniref:NUDIX domain-containing protein n=1 Tax=Tardiphaga robiniae TaxID=943830 RepID=A0A7G6TTE2_9BRAD|nr:NUDIX domain-containing protein [Tardiphaga robiniae]QND70024.1 NUDIX domain-containing protein [Tardiphaga robiniae]